MNLPESLRDIQELPIFPLPVVLFPGMLMPLHIFEPRYRQLLRDCLEGERRFGLTYHPNSSVGKLVVPVEGSIGCLARITAVIPLPDGRSNIMTSGLCRYRTLQYLSQDPYLVASIELFLDEPESSEEVEVIAQEVKSLFARFVNALRILRDEPHAPYQLPEAAEVSSFMIAAVVLTEVEHQLEVLQMRSTLNRFQFLKEYLDEVIDEIEARARQHVAFRRNGHRTKTIH